MQWQYLHITYYVLLWNYFQVDPDRRNKPETILLYNSQKAGVDCVNWMTQVKLGYIYHYYIYRNSYSIEF